MQARRYTIQDIAKEAKVGVGTVSRVLNDDPNVKNKTREHVQAVITKLGYQPNYMARSLRSQKSNTIGFISDAVATTPFAVNMIKGAQDAAWKQNKLLLIVDADNNPEIREKAIDSMLEREVEGIVYAAMFHQEIQPSKKLGVVPTVLVDCFDKNSSFLAAVPDEKQGGYTATKELITHGHQRIGHISNDPLNMIYPAAGLRFQGYCEALEEANIPFEQELIREGSEGKVGGYAKALELFQTNNPPTALYCGTDRIAMGAYEALKSLGLRIPEDVSVIGFDNQEVIAEQLYPRLTTVALPHEEMGRWAINQLLSSKVANPRKELISCPLIKRDSVRALA